VETVWILGAGRFGRHAAAGLEAEGTTHRLVLLDPSPESLAAAAGPGRSVIQADGVAYLVEHLRPERADDAPDWIVPALPVHLPAEWCLGLLGPQGLQRRPVPPAVLDQVPQPLPGATGDLYVSHARFRCPAHCVEPEDRCTVTQEPRPRNLFEILEHLAVPPYRSLVVRSQQLGAGIGGYRPRQLFALLGLVESSGPRLLVSTACRCHGVLTALEYRGEGTGGDPAARS
jgi:hypothetical protein